MGFRFAAAGLMAFLVATSAAAQDQPFSQTIRVDTAYQNVCELTVVRAMGGAPVEQSRSNYEFIARRDGERLVFAYAEGANPRIVAWTAPPQQVLGLRETIDSLELVPGPDAADAEWAAQSGGQAFTIYDWLLDGRMVVHNAPLLEASVLGALEGQGQAMADEMGAGTLFRIYGNVAFRGLQATSSGQSVLVFDGGYFMSLSGEGEGATTQQVADVQIWAAYDPTTGLLVSARERSVSAGAELLGLSGKVDTLRTITCRAERL